MINPRLYSITVKYGTFEGENCYEAKVLELPDVAEYADSYEEAYELALDTIKTTAEIFLLKNRSMPQPQNTNDEFSGRVTLRIPKSLHRGLAIKALEENLSLNQLLVSVLSAFRGFDSAMYESTNSWIDIPATKTNRYEPNNKKITHLRKYTDQQAANW